MTLGMIDVLLFLLNKKFLFQRWQSLLTPRFALVAAVMVTLQFGTW